MALIILIIILIYLVVITSTWHNLGLMEKSKKIIIITIELIVIYVITLVIFYISKSNIQDNILVNQNMIKNTIIAVFTGINALIMMPLIAKITEKINENKIDKSKLLRNIIIIIAIFIICISLECGYMKDTQEKILKIYNSKIEDK